ncbi:uncharacterized protein SPSK_10776 [Sporothrix schenckii 1099-18]|uniref:Uncharacterized protein n=1 Tax=Sporothrix schenckii 1099-18 TaxID=1397361 RepID=A0A0F2MF93_SPOSC|nr:uncharacterized protein SPSK_10776 [Sporothrix schenckii 1099-18]KJR87749.1 hypothetical protein SPSK_10776 [Sporothrix schenckii 1099-18]
MFSSQPESSDFDYPRGPLKRFHEDEVATDGMNGSTVGFTEHRNKRLQTLPFRTSPTSPRKWDLAVGADAGQQRPDPAITPPGSFSESAPQHAAQHAAVQQQQSIYGQQSGVPAVVESSDMDMDMATDDMLSPPAHVNHAQQQQQHQHLVPGPSQPDQDSVIASRMPTPIQPSFAVQVRGNNWGGAAGNVMHNSMVAPTPTDPVAAEDRSVPRSLEHPAVLGEWSMVQNRSLPSPISESGGEEAAGSPDMVLDSMALQGGLGQSPGHENIEGCGEHDDDLLGTPTRSSAMHSHTPMAASSPIRGSGSTLDSDPAATPSPRKGHTRSRHTIVAWTQQPGMKKSFSIGYRADCEKCRNRVPGHFNHIIVS